MKTLLTKAILTFFLAVATVPCLAQQSGTVSFTYDENGNRIMRSINIRKVSENGKNVESQSPTLGDATDVFANMKVSIYPNPTKGMVFISAEGDEGEHTLQIRLTNTAGIVLQEKEYNGNLESIDLSDLPVGVYLLQLTSDNEVHVWKIIKN